MKKWLALAFLILSGSLFIYSQVPQAMTYKAIAKGDWGIALPNKAITLRFTIIQGSEYGTEVYRETHKTTTSKFGLMDVKIGLGAADIGNFSSIDWSTGVYYIRIEMDPKGGNDFRLEDPPHQLLSVPYVLYAGAAANADETDPIYTATFTITDPQDGDLLRFKATTGKWEVYTPQFAAGEVS